MGSKNTDSSDALALAQMQALQAMEKGKTEAFGHINKGEGSILEHINPLVPTGAGIMKRSMDGVNNIDALHKAENERVQNIYMKPAQEQIRTQLDNLYSKAGIGGNNNSRYQNMMFRNSEEMANNEMQRQYQLENQTRNNLMNKFGQEYQFGAQPVMYKSGIDMDLMKTKANTSLGAASQISGIHTQMGQAIAQAKKDEAIGEAAGKAGVGSALGSGLSMGASILSDIRAKENLVEIGTLNKTKLKVYTFNYKWDKKTKHTGVIAQEVLKKYPYMVDIDKNTGFLAVNYGQIIKEEEKNNG